MIHKIKQYKALFVIGMIILLLLFNGFILKHQNKAIENNRPIDDIAEEDNEGAEENRETEEEYTTELWEGRELTYKIYTVENNVIKFMNETEHFKEFMESLDIKPNDIIEMNNVIFQVQENYNLEVYNIPVKPAREINTDFQMGKEDKREIGDVLDYDVYSDGIKTGKEKQEFMDARGMTPGTEMKLGKYVYKITDDYRLEVIDIIDIEIDDIYNDLPPIDVPVPIEKSGLPYNVRFFIKEQINSSKYFVSSNESVQMVIIPEDTGFKQFIEVSLVEKESNQIINKVSLDITDFAVYQVNFILDNDVEFYVQIDNKSEKSQIMGNYSIK